MPSGVGPAVVLACRIWPVETGVAVDALLFHKAGCPPALRDGVIPPLLSCVCRAMAIARLTHLKISIPSSGAPPGQVPAECFPEGDAPCASVSSSPSVVRG